MMSSEEEEALERLKFKIVVLGDAAVGKTSLMWRLVHAQFLGK